MRGWGDVEGGCGRFDSRMVGCVGEGKGEKGGVEGGSCWPWLAGWESFLTLLPLNDNDDDDNDEI